MRIRWVLRRLRLKRSREIWAASIIIRTADSIGLLCRVTAALERCQLDVRSARVTSTAGSVVDAFYVTTRDGQLFLVMNYIAGEPLSPEKLAGRTSMDERLHLFVTICRAVGGGFSLHRSSTI